MKSGNKTKTAWRHVLTGNQADRAWQFISQVDKDLNFAANNLFGENIPDFWVLSLVGSCLLSHHLYSFTGKKKYYERAESLLNQGVEILNKVSIDSQLYFGLTGLAWTSEFFRKESKIKEWPAMGDPNRAVDDLILSQVRAGSKEAAKLGKYGLMDGWVGLGVYALDRWPQGSSVKIVEQVVKLLDKKAKRSAQGAAWFSTKSFLSDEFRSGHYNLGLAHGHPGVIAFLSDVVKLGICRDLAGGLLKEALSWLLNQDDGHSFASFTPAKSSNKKFPPQLSWCYGDLSISIVLLNSARILKDPALEKKALLVAYRAVTLSQKAKETESVCVCHGTAGFFHLFNRLYQYTGDPIFLKSAMMWVKKTLNQVQEQESSLSSDFDLLTGKTGIALSLLSGISDLEPAWDRFLLLRAAQR